MKRTMTPAFEGPIVGFSGERCIIRVQIDPGGKGWRVNVGPLSALLHTQVWAIGFARDCAVFHTEHGAGGLAQVVLHGKDGRIRWERTYGADPRRTKG